jgi:hypothetical protein
VEVAASLSPLGGKGRDAYHQSEDHVRWLPRGRGARRPRLVHRELNVKCDVSFSDEAFVKSVAIAENGRVYVVTSKRMRLAWRGTKLSTDEADGAWKSRNQSIGMRRLSSAPCGEARARCQRRWALDTISTSESSSPMRSRAGRISTSGSADVRRTLKMTRSRIRFGTR